MLGVRNICVHKENVTPLKMDIAYAVQRDRITCLTGNVDRAERGRRGLWRRERERGAVEEEEVQRKAEACLS